MSHFPYYGIIRNKAHGRIWLYYNIATVAISNVILHEQLIHCDVWFKATNQAIALTCVYGLNDPTTRVALWDKLTEISQTTSAWAVMGDFNFVRSLSEREAPNPPATQDILAFNACLAKCYLDDMHRMGSEFTWSNKQGSDTRTWARLDRVLVNPAWLTMFPASYALSMPPGPSGHSPLIMSLAPASPIKRRLSFLNAWQDHPNYQELIQKRVQALRGQLEDCQTELQTNLFSPLLIEKEKQLAGQYAKLCKTEVDYFGRPRYGIDNVNAAAFVDYYTSLLGRKINVTPISDIVFSSGPGVLEKAGIKLIAPVTREEIRKALFSISPNKGPGQDGFSSGFFKKDWDTVRDTFCAAVEEFFRKGRLVRKVNTTLLALIPKKAVPLAVQDFRPIACCSVVYKTISKILAS
ncbi:uncharacterized protein LOC141607320 [Silene latifolia]|uniref:uncharacterized protein LOC141607320 n=1 Tax=Silene latifolia TaxID=37657 RepID=UPI003D77AB58